jgi:hypothetical protein
MQAAVGRRERHIYTLKRDDDIYRAVARYQFITAEILTELTGRDHKTIQKRLQFLYEANYLNRQRRDELAPYAYFLSEKGAQEAVRIGSLPELRFIKAKSRMIISHDLEITYFHRAVEKSFGPVEWEQWRGDLKDDVGGEALIPDARFTLKDNFFFLEIVKSYESEYENGISNIERKFAQYSAYKEQFKRKYGHDDFRVLWVLPTEARVLGLLAKIEDKYPFRRFYVTHEQLYQDNIKGKIWWTPKDFRDATYSLLLS